MRSLPRVYVSSKVRHAFMWKTYRDPSRYDIVSSWIDRPTSDIDPDVFSSMWSDFIDECAACDYLILYKAADDSVLKGAIVEFGAALAGGAEILLVSGSGEIAELGTAIYHPRVSTFSHVESAFDHLVLKHDRSYFSPDHCRECGARCDNCACGLSCID